MSNNKLIENSKKYISELKNKLSELGVKEKKLTESLKKSNNDTKIVIIFSIAVVALLVALLKSPLVVLQSEKLLLSVIITTMSVAPIVYIVPNMYLKRLAKEYKEKNADYTEKLNEEEKKLSYLINKTKSKEKQNEYSTDKKEVHNEILHNNNELEKPKVLKKEKRYL